MLLVDDDALVRAGLRIILSSAEDLEVVGEAADPNLGLFIRNGRRLSVAEPTQTSARP